MKCFDLVTSCTTRLLSLHPHLKVTDNPAEGGVERIQMSDASLEASSPSSSPSSSSTAAAAAASSSLHKRSDGRNVSQIPLDVSCKRNSVLPQFGIEPLEFFADLRAKIPLEVALCLLLYLSLRVVAREKDARRLLQHRRGEIRDALPWFLLERVQEVDVRLRIRPLERVFDVLHELVRGAVRFRFRPHRSDIPRGPAETGEICRLDLRVGGSRVFGLHLHGQVERRY